MILLFLTAMVAVMFPSLAIAVLVVAFVMWVLAEVGQFAHELAVERRRAR